jgi:hypothetical protein
MSDKTVPADLRRLVSDRARYCCEYCRAQTQYSADPFTVDHIKPRSLDGPTTSENLALACYGCNQHKSKRVVAPDPVTDLWVPLFHPRDQAWEEHFAWNDDFSLILGLTATGRATVVALQLNRRGLVSIRRVLHAIGEHPPAQILPAALPNPQS